MADWQAIRQKIANQRYDVCEQWWRLERWRWLPWVAIRRAFLVRVERNLRTMEELAERRIKYGGDE